MKHKLIFSALSILILTFCSNIAIGQSFSTKHYIEPLPKLVVVGDEIVEFTEYCNARFDFCIEYPVNILLPNPAPANQDGREFISANDNIEVAAFGMYRINESLADYFEQIQEVITYKPENQLFETILTDSYFMITGFVDGKMYYQKTFLEDNKFVSLIIESEIAPKQTPSLADLQSEIISSFSL